MTQASLFPSSQRSRSFRPWCLLLALMLLSVPGLWAQSDVLSAGGDASNASGSLSYSVGQLAYVPIDAAAGSVLPGVQQPIELFAITSVLPQVFAGVQVYPNPAQQELIVEKELAAKAVAFQLSSLDGKILQQGSLSSVQTILPLSQLSPAVYLLQLRGENGALQTFKIVKN